MIIYANTLHDVYILAMVDCDKNSRLNWVFSCTVCMCVSDYWKGGTLWTSCCYCQHCRKSSLLTACGLSGKHAFCFTPPSPIIYFYVGLFENLCTKDMSYREKKVFIKRLLWHKPIIYLTTLINSLTYSLCPECLLVQFGLVHGLPHSQHYFLC